MSIFTYTATRELSPGTADQQIVTRDFRLLTFPLNRKPVAKRNTSLSGAVESLLFRSEQSFRCQTALLEPRSLVESRVVEFLASVENSETFTFDRYGSIAQPDNPVSAIMVSTSYPQTETGKAFHQYRFVIREA